MFFAYHYTKAQVVDNDSSVISNNRSRSLTIAYIDDYLGNSFTLTYGFKFSNRNMINVGTKFHINRVIRDRFSYVFHDRFYADDLFERFGLNFTYKYKINFSNSNLEPYIGYNLYLSYLSHIVEHYNYYKKPVLDRKYIISENMIITGFRAKLYKKIYLTQNIGLGEAVFYRRKDEKDYGGCDPICDLNSKKNKREYIFEFNPVYLLSIGIEYEF